jgi:uncharacterized Zn finger protein (UPF0148 family)
MANMKTVSLVDHETRKVQAEAQHNLRDLYQRLEADVANLNAAIDQVRAAVEKLRGKLEQQ